MNASAKTGIYVLLLALGLSATPTRLLSTTLDIAIIGLLCMVVLNLRTTRNSVDNALAWVALWAVIAVLGAPLVPLWHGLADLVSGGAV